MRYNILLIALLVLSVQSCINPIKQKNPEPVVVSGVLVRRDTIAVRESFISSLTPNYVAIVQPRVNGYLAAKLFSNGMPVKRGEVIFRIDNRKQSADVLSAAATLEAARANAIEAENNYNRAIPLAKIDAISKAQLDQYTAQYNAAKANVKSAEQNLKNARLELDYTT
ncbi:MAG: efflux RND transporter periplasmic adaptor subunit, partial [Alistipes sp.]|nr:efflux RND transporter periplasmic adaptor subunit [Alistipes sp.]